MADEDDDWLICAPVILLFAVPMLVLLAVVGLVGLVRKFAVWRSR